ncbi:asparagine synthase (glutamine-hydrolyzing) [Geoglobus acetivorans]|uniref:Putative asparagine synthetase [glutamine-hydrolyzing] n=1 Tax=Geoglobus acetivorans TaxID=565033 RepID=A0ABZ3H5K7_GEOAI|nr:asparagine synthase (glutamine-hydrolyzing) [Geoglobus acetivorans]
MCGIAGIAGKDLNKQWIFTMAESLKHRGPDDEGYLLVNTDKKIFEERGGRDSKIPLKCIEESVNFDVDLVLGHRRLSILDPTPAGHQPMKYEKDRVVWIVYNGEIYNYLEIKEELKRKGYEFKTDSDTEVVLAAYLEWGFDCVKKFNGMWAFVIYDPENNILFGSRDRFGIKPLYYTRGRNFFVFASEIKAILALPFIKRTVNESVLYDYLIFGVLEHTNETFFSGIYKLLPSHSFVYYIKKNELKIFKHYRLKYCSELSKFSEKEFKEYRDNVKSRIFRAIELRLRSDVPVGTCLSGGIDSSSIAVVINSILKRKKVPQIGKKQKVFTAYYSGEPMDESKYAEKVVESIGAEWYRVAPTAEDLLKDLLDLVYYQEEPFISTSMYSQYRVMRLAKENGIKVLLDGQGGDELFAGYKIFYGAYFLDLLKNLKIWTLMKELRNLRNSPVDLKDLITQVSRIIFAKVIPSALKWTIVRRMYPEMKYINKDFLSKFKYRDYTREITSTSLNEICYQWFTKHNLQQLLRYEDRNSMAHSIEARVPFSDDTELIEYVFMIPGTYKIHRGWSKFILREALSDLLPAEIKKRTDKVGFETPEKIWLSKMSDEIKKLINYKNPYIDTEKLVADYDTLVANLPNRGLNALWRLINTILWMKVFNVKPPQ